MAKRIPRSHADDMTAAVAGEAKPRARSPRRTAGAAIPEPPLAATTPAEGRRSRAHAAPAEEEIRLRAYHRYLERGSIPGNDVDDWLQAERELTQPHD
jgi:hypothetical protein